MKKDIIKQQIILTILATMIIILPLADGYFLFSQPKTDTPLFPSPSVPVLNMAVYQSVWDKASKRQMFGTSPSAELNFSSLPYGRADPFHP